jgi:hypothetical protein
MKRSDAKPRKARPASKCFEQREKCLARQGTAKELKEETGLYYYGARYLDPKNLLEKNNKLTKPDFIKEKNYLFSYYLIFLLFFSFFLCCL